ncbi:type II toxin-antitoxin system RelE/ParE family toxin [Streptomyces sp. SP17BM10]|uniref:type II toxin-antitoxin system RelE/ParE family toxin n=1 Tax=Streptomyces sp. SP17BM10 TaxID=3002530 RepID=UPI002E775CF1|nr:type II toxin-antitoxin system RelE/ParE family toxin [Streptomyces sp. SP17BM10]MEE1785047.1 type II toxin-antitoxin system RelE/ParE family toxin [Streptomyces sp. SP17BM10]
MEPEPEVRDRTFGLNQEGRETAAFSIDLPAARGPLPGEPYTRQPDMRITYWIASGRRIVLLTAFRKTRMREAAEVDRARRTPRRCMTEQHTVEEDDE